MDVAFWLLFALIAALVYLLVTQSTKQTFFQPPTRKGEHAVVLGFGIGGLLASKVLSRHFDKVTVIERDDLSTSWVPSDGEIPGSRRGVPQGSQFHNVITRAHEIMEELLPGFGEIMLKNGVTPADMTDQLAWNTPYGWIHSGKSDLVIKPSSRGLIEYALRERVLATTPNLTLLQKTTVTALLFDKQSNTVQGVRYMDKATQDEVELPADFVVDCGGRNSKHTGVHFLNELGIEVQEESVDAGIGYASAFYRFEPGTEPIYNDIWGDGDQKKIHALLVQAYPHLDQPEGFVMGLAEHNLYHFNWYGFCKQYPPTTDEGILEWSKKLRSDVVVKMLSRGQRVSPLIPYRDTKTARIRVDKCKNWPENYVLVGDSMAYFTPVYGQGMTFASLLSVSLDAALSESPDEMHLHGVSKDFNKKAWKAVETCWATAAGGDFLAPGVKANCTPPPGFKFINAYFGYLLRLLSNKNTYTPQLHRTVMGVLQMLTPPYALFSPFIVYQILKLKWGDMQEAKKAKAKEQ